MQDYGEKIMEHIRDPRNRRVMEDADIVSPATNPTCGDVTTFYIKVEDSYLSDVSFETNGCEVALAVSSMLTEMARGKTFEEAQNLTPGFISFEFEGIPANKISCSQVGAQALQKAIQDYLSKKGVSLEASHVQKEKDYRPVEVRRDVEKVTLIIDDQKVEAKVGSTILEAARKAGIHVPTLCYHPFLSPYGGCRLCVVEVEKVRGYPTACTMPVGDGMVVRTKTPQLQALRQDVLELILTEHPHVCFTCDRRQFCQPADVCVRHAPINDRCVVCPKNRRCELQEVAEYIGVKEGGLLYTYRGLPIYRDSSPFERDFDFLERNYNLCILCGRCVRVCDEVKKVKAIVFTWRGSQTLVGTAFNRSLLESGCQFCGQCADVCPTAAIMKGGVKKSASLSESTALSNKIKEVSSMSQQYSERIMEHVNNPRNRRVMEDADIVAPAPNPTCGDITTFYLKVKDNRLEDVSFETNGCEVATAVSSILTEMAKGRTVEEAQDLTPDFIQWEIEDLPADKRECSRVGARALQQALEDYLSKK